MASTLDISLPSPLLLDRSEERSVELENLENVDFSALRSALGKFQAKIDMKAEGGHSPRLFTPWDYGVFSHVVLVFRLECRGQQAKRENPAANGRKGPPPGIARCCQGHHRRVREER